MSTPRHRLGTLWLARGNTAVSVLQKPDSGLPLLWPYLPGPQALLPTAGSTRGIGLARHVQPALVVLSFVPADGGEVPGHTLHP